MKISHSLVYDLLPLASPAPALLPGLHRGGVGVQASAHTGYALASGNKATMALRSVAHQDTQRGVIAPGGRVPASLLSVC